MQKMKESLFYEKLKDNAVRCILCPNFCMIKENNVGICRTRKNINGKLFSLTYGRPVAINIDPLTKKPIFHMLPGSYSYSIGTAGCQLSCRFCQNFEISQSRPEDFNVKYVKPEKIVKDAIKNNCKSISYTYNDIVAFYEYALDIAKIAKKHGIKNVIVCNGYINPVPLKKLCKYIDAANVDLKSMNEGFYKNICNGRLKPVLESLKIIKNEHVWLEITNLLIPSLNDSHKETESLVNWIRNNLGIDQVLHFSRYYPVYKIALPPTKESTLQEARSIAKKQLNYVYIGNILIENSEDTYCPDCNYLLVKRKGFEVIENHVKNGKCYKCKKNIPGIWK